MLPAGKRKQRRGPDGKFKAKTKIQDRPREHGRFVSASGISHMQLTETQIRPLMRYCRITAAEMLKVSTYQLSMACSRLGLKWPRWPEVPTPEHHKALNRKKKKERIPKNAVAFFYCEKTEDSGNTATRFHELRISSDGRAVFARWGRPGVTNNYAWRANKKMRFALKEDALAYCRSQKAEYRLPDGWIEKTAPIPPNSKPKSKRKAMQSVQNKRKLFKEQNKRVKEMNTANLIKVGTHSQEEIDAATKQLEAMRTKMYRAVRQAKGLVEATKDQRKKVADMKQANYENPGSHTEEELNNEMMKLRELMSKYSKRTLVPPSELRKKEGKEEGVAVDEPDLKRMRPDLGRQVAFPPPPWPSPPPTFLPPPQHVARALEAPTHVWCTGSCARLRKPWCNCPNVAPVVAPPIPPQQHFMSSPMTEWHQQQHLQQQLMLAWPRGLGPDGVYYGGWPFGSMQLRSCTEYEGRAWPMLCLPNGTKLPPSAVGVRADPNADARAHEKTDTHANARTHQKTVSTPLYYARELFDHVVDAHLSQSARKKKWERLFKTGAGRDGPLVDYVLWTQGSTNPATGTARPDALVSFNGMMLIIKAVGNDAAKQWLQEYAFFHHPYLVLEPRAHTAAAAPAIQPHAAAGGHAANFEQGPLAHSGDELVRQAMKLLARASEQSSASEHHVALSHMLDELRLPERGRDSEGDAREMEAEPAIVESAPEPG